MTEVFKYDVFLSHSPEDKTVARELAAQLKRDGVRVWLYEEQIKPGDSIPAKVEDGLEHSRVLVLCMSANAFGSDWARLESYTFRFHDPLNKERRFIPLRLDDSPIKGSLAQFVYINWQPAFREQEYASLLAASRGELHLSSTSQSSMAVKPIRHEDSLWKLLFDLGVASCVNTQFRLGIIAAAVLVVIIAVGLFLRDGKVGFNVKNVDVVPGKISNINFVQGDFGAFATNKLLRYSGGAAIPSLPQIAISTFPPGSYDGQLYNPKVRMHQLTVRNLSGVDIYNFCSRLQLPEPILETTITNAPPGTSLRWRPIVARNFVLDPSGLPGKPPPETGVSNIKILSKYGMFLPDDTCFTPKDEEDRCVRTWVVSTQDLNGVWELTIDKLPPSRQVRIEFTTSNGSAATNYIRLTTAPLSRPSNVLGPGTNELKFFIEGEFWYRTEITNDEQYFIVPISFDSGQRVITSFPLQVNLGRWRPTLLNSIRPF